MELKSVLIVKIIVLSVIISGSLCQKPVYKCALSGTTCTFSDVFLTSTHYEWQPTSDDPNIVREVKFFESKIIVVAKGICEAFPFLKLLELGGLGIEEVQEDAFHACNGLTELGLTNNQIKNFYPSTFLYTKNLETLYLYRNEIEKLEDYNLFSNLPELDLIELSNNNLREFSSELIRNNKKLTALYLNINELSDIEAETIVDFLPNLKWFWLENNEFACIRVVQIQDLLRSKCISYGTSTNRKVRYCPQQTVFGGLKCNSDISWIASEEKGNHNLEMMEKKLSKIETTSLKVDDLKQEMKEENLKMDQRFVKLEEKIEQLVTVISQLKTLD